MLRKCKKCNQEKQIEKFVKQVGRKDPYRNECKECKNKKRRTGRPHNKGVFKSKRRFSLFYKKFREEIYERDGSECKRCGVKENLHAHHIKPWNDNEELRYEPENWITLCVSCHSIVEPKLKNGNIPWNKGKKGIYNQEYRSKISSSLKGKIPWNKGMKDKQIAWNKGKAMCEETKRKISETKRNKINKDNK